jgi:hypothetical protein
MSNSVQRQQRVQYILMSKLLVNVYMFKKNFCNNVCHGGPKSQYLDCKIKVETQTDDAFTGF